MVNDTPIPHGTYSGYVRHKCRCEECKEAAAAYRRAGPKSPIPHGKLSGYTYHKCRCEKCKAASREYLQRKRPPREPKPLPHGTWSGYSYHKCRCDECVAAMRAQGRKHYKSRPRQPKPIQHGTTTGYGYHKCRCDECKAAQSEYNRKHRELNLERYRERRRQNYKANAAKEAEDRRRFRENNPDYRRNHYEANREKTLEDMRRWRAENPERIRELQSLSQNRRRARMREAFVEDVLPLEIFERDNWQCQIPGCLYPGIPASLDAGRYHPLLASMDHVIPLSKGGKHERSNLACSHLRCNLAKNARIEGIA